MTTRILRIITRMNVGGPATHVLLADRGLRDRGWDTLLLHGQVEPDEAEVELSTAGVPLGRIPTLARPIRPTADARAFAEIARAIRQYRPHVIHTHLSKAGLLGRSAGMLLSPAVRIHTFHGTLFGGYFGQRTTGVVVRAERFLGQRTARVIALSERQREELLAERIAPPARIEIVPLGLDLVRFGGIDQKVARAELGIPADSYAVAAIGRLVPIKRLDVLVNAFAKVLGRVPAGRLYLVGDGSERAELERRVSELGLGNAVTFVGWSTDTPRWYASADVIALTSDREGTPLALIEAAASGRAVVATDVGGVADVVEHGVTGYIVPAGDSDALAERLIELGLQPGARQRLAAAAPGRAARFDAPRLVDELDGLYRRVLAEQAGTW